jgi:hypothetical protein
MLARPQNMKMQGCLDLRPHRRRMFGGEYPVNAQFLRRPSCRHGSSASRFQDAPKTSVSTWVPALHAGTTKPRGTAATNGGLSSAVFSKAKELEVLAREVMTQLAEVIQRLKQVVRQLISIRRRSFGMEQGWGSAQPLEAANSLAVVGWMS